MAGFEFHFKLLVRAFGQIQFSVPHLRMIIKHNRMLGVLSHYYEIVLLDQLVKSLISRYSSELSDRSNAAR